MVLNLHPFSFKNHQGKGKSMEHGSYQQNRGTHRDSGRTERSHNALRHDDEAGWSRPSQYWNQYGSHRWNTGGSYEDSRDLGGDWTSGGWGSGARLRNYDNDRREQGFSVHGERYDTDRSTDTREQGFSPYGERYHPTHSIGQYYGRGPKGYQRSDERIQDDVCERLTRDPRVDASEIEVSVKEGEVTLSGTVVDRRQKRTAEDTIEHVLGVKEVHNRIRVTHSASEQQHRL
jgi:hypothetical protein